uniref:Acetoacetyl-CoA synthetase n=1 Tax=Caenorhabditis tropicalis TaxID=1561998 RepID=A0A1I7TWJ3_9PELO
MTAVSANGKVTEKHENGAHVNGTNGIANGNGVAHVHAPQPVYYKPPQNLETFELALRKHFEEKTNQKFADYREFHRFTCDNYGIFWEDLLKISEVKLHQTYNQVINHNLKINERPRWFNGATLNYTENVIERGTATETAVLNASIDGSVVEYTFDNLRKDVYRTATSLRNYGIGPGDTVCGFVPNTYDTLVAVFATAAVGAAWCSASVDFGPAGVLDRFRQVHPKVLFTVNHVTYKKKLIDQTDKINEIVKELPTLEKIVVSDTFTSIKFDASKYNQSEKFVSLNEFKTPEADVLLPFAYTPVPFSDPLFVMFSSGTTGIPKAMVHTVGGTLLKHIEEHLVQGDSKKHDRMFFYTTCGWMMYNWMISFLYSKGSVVLFDECPLAPDTHILMKIASKTQCTMIGMGAKLYDEYLRLQIPFNALYDLSKIHTVYSTGSPLKKECFAYINTYIAPGALIASISGGTDIIGCFVGGIKSLSIVPGECQCLFLGMDIKSFNYMDEEITNSDEQGELVCVTPFPSMPSHFLNDTDGKKYRDAYFARLEPFWAHGDFVRVNHSTGGVEMLGRSDATLNRGGVRIGTAEIYSVVEKIPQVADCIVAGRLVEEGMDEEVLLFVKMVPGQELTHTIQAAIVSKLRNDMSPRHVPNKIYAVDDIPYTSSGKKVEVAVKQIVSGKAVQKASSIRNPESLDHFVQYKL